jgi:hypothetical protein
VWPTEIIPLRATRAGAASWAAASTSIRTLIRILRPASRVYQVHSVTDIKEMEKKEILAWVDKTKIQDKINFLASLPIAV